MNLDMTRLGNSSASISSSRNHSNLFNAPMFVQKKVFRYLDDEIVPGGWLGHMSRSDASVRVLVHRDQQRNLDLAITWDQLLSWSYIVENEVSSSPCQYIWLNRWIPKAISHTLAFHWLLARGQSLLDICAPISEIPQTPFFGSRRV